MTSVRQALVLPHGIQFIGLLRRVNILRMFFTEFVFEVVRVKKTLTREGQFSRGTD